MKNIIVFCLIFTFTFSVTAQENNNEIRTINFKRDENGYIQFFTNDKELFGAGLIGSPNDYHNPNNFEMEIIKNSGSETVGCGMIFGAQDDATWYAVFISPNGYYFIVRSINSAMVTLTDGNTQQINRGLGRNNTVRAVRNGRNYEIYLNNNRRPLYTIRNIEFEGIKMGYFVMVGDSRFESFPNNPVDIRFLKK